jgi:hypothetical protein
LLLFINIWRFKQNQRVSPNPCPRLDLSPGKWVSTGENAYGMRSMGITDAPKNSQAWHERSLDVTVHSKDGKMLAGSF